MAEKARTAFDWFLDLTLEFFLVEDTPPQRDPGLATDQENPLSLRLSDPSCKTAVTWRVLHPPSRTVRITQIGLNPHTKRGVKN